MERMKPRVQTLLPHRPVGLNEPRVSAYGKCRLLCKAVVSTRKCLNGCLLYKFDSADLPRCLQKARGFSFRDVSLKLWSCMNTRGSRLQREATKGVGVAFFLSHPDLHVWTGLSHDTSVVSASSFLKKGWMLHTGCTLKSLGCFQDILTHEAHPTRIENTSLGLGPAHAYF